MTIERMEFGCSEKRHMRSTQLCPSSWSRSMGTHALFLDEATRTAGWFCCVIWGQYPSEKGREERVCTHCTDKRIEAQRTVRKEVKWQRRDRSSYCCSGGGRGRYVGVTDTGTLVRRVFGTSASAMVEPRASLSALMRL